MKLKRHWFRAVKNHCKARKIHSSGDMRLGHRIGKVRKTDECAEICRNKANIDKKPLVNGVGMSFARGLCLNN